MIVADIEKAVAPLTDRKGLDDKLAIIQATHKSDPTKDTIGFVSRMFDEDGNTFVFSVTLDPKPESWALSFTDMDDLTNVVSTKLLKTYPEEEFTLTLLYFGTMFDYELEKMKTI